MPGAWGVQRRAFQLLEMELQLSVSIWVLRIEPGSSGSVAGALNCQALSGAKISDFKETNTNF